VRDATTVTIVFGAETWADAVLGVVDQDEGRGEQGILQRAVANATSTL
jgi:hypothetical protein